MKKQKWIWKKEEKTQKSDEKVEIKTGEKEREKTQKEK